MEEESVLRCQPTERSVAWLIEQLPLPTRLEAAHHEAYVFRSRERGQTVVTSGVSTDNGGPTTLRKMFKACVDRREPSRHAIVTLYARYFLF